MKKVHHPLEYINPPGFDGDTDGVSLHSIERPPRELRRVLYGLRAAIGHEPNDLDELRKENIYPYPRINTGVVAVVYVYEDGRVSWYCEGLER
jgi:hypothetical protein